MDHLEEFRFANGMAFTDSQVQTLVSAMATFGGGAAAGGTPVLSMRFRTQDPAVRVMA
jgi:phage tail tape-measure protein